MEYQQCTTCNSRIGSHTMVESYRCGIINKTQAETVFKTEDVWECLKLKMITKEDARKMFTKITKK
jgi:ABC-type uncharacterized transport system ATPase subunit